MPSTPTLGFPYQAPSDAPDVPYGQQQLAEALDAYLAPPGWTAMTGFTAGANPDGTQIPQYRVKNGKVELRGTVNATTTFAGSGVAIITLPAGVRPLVTRHYPVATSFASANTSDARIDIASTGVVTLFCPASERNWFSFDGIWFYTS